MLSERNEDFVVEPSVTRLRRGIIKWAPGREQVSEGELFERDNEGVPTYRPFWRPLAEEAHVS